ncbi:class I SAM-dependent methyltransferase [Virgibacillus halodenitrificans]|uniref:Class I SAM-dependent methyltransferase n=1 Tax=Virgibacillus halodenitrificans TaxID=1482 RepID=A0ABR7VK03_VIRHA|nr:class I SAM-dependent methyltransferase [Virgibacillus halodenitrificans]MBD1221616.1 class I SAM-dependent methyltransferase [Virgibacillus halodenitrificans]
MSKKHWNDQFSEAYYIYGEDPNAFIKENSNRIPSHSSIGCFAEGEGRNAVYLAGLGHEVTVYDQAEEGLNKARQLADKNKVTIETKAIDLVQEKVAQNQYDAAILVFGHVPKNGQETFFTNIFNSVKPGGYILFEVYSEDQFQYKTGGPPTIENLYDPASILNWIKEYKCLHFYYGEAVRNEGSKHTGLCHVIQGIVQK